MVAPGTVDEEEGRGEALQPEARPSHQSDGRHVAGLDAGFEPVQTERPEGMADDESEPLGRQSTTRGVGANAP
ncbi:hypothetical protein SCWH03_52850 [Streptomyces pacificus]|uniref:Uncharacterized protein n=1 Tax=Streptomyces pacificus TaxID=2705029 RepID=A0A6A0B189_9ACTN|nr:hypothetical protein SCWH03_52850 [Streptomyces pacificus]